MASSNDPAQAAAQALFPTSLPGAELEVALPLPAWWQPGAELHLRGPLGRGFSLPRSARRVVLAARACPPGLLAPLAQLALQQGAEVTFLSTEPPHNLPEAVEILPPDLLAETLPWADFFGAALPLVELANLRRQAGLRIHQRAHCTAEALLLTPLACAGLAACGACALLTPRGWKLACADGPVFHLNDLELL